MQIAFPNKDILRLGFGLHRMRHPTVPGRKRQYPRFLLLFYPWSNHKGHSRAIKDADQVSRLSAVRHPAQAPLGRGAEAPVRDLSKTAYNSPIIEPLLASVFSAMIAISRISAPFPYLVQGGAFSAYRLLFTAVACWSRTSVTVLYDAAHDIQDSLEPSSQEFSGR